MGRRQLERITEPLALDPVRPALVGTVAWAVALVVLLVLREQLAPQDRWWLWTAAAGLVMGLVGSAAALRRRRQSVGVSSTVPAADPSAAGSAEGSTSATTGTGASATASGSTGSSSAGSGSVSSA